MFEVSPPSPQIPLWIVAGLLGAGMCPQGPAAESAQQAAIRKFAESRAQRRLSSVLQKECPDTKKQYITSF